MARKLVGVSGHAFYRCSLNSDKGVFGEYAHCALSAVAPLSERREIKKKKLREREQLKKRYQTQAILSASTRQNDLLDPSIDPSISLCFDKALIICEHSLWLKIAIAIFLERNQAICCRIIGKMQLEFLQNWRFMGFDWWNPWTKLIPEAVHCTKQSEVAGLSPVTCYN